jgi:hypothetical protein
MMKRLTHTVCTLWAGLAQASTVWNPAANGVFPPATGNWNVAGNWTQRLPFSVADGKAVFNVANAAECRVTNTQTCGPFLQGDNGPGDTTVKAVAGNAAPSLSLMPPPTASDALPGRVTMGGGEVFFSKLQWRPGVTRWSATILGG